MDEGNENLLITVGIAAGAYFGIVKPLLATFGLSDADKALVNGVDQLTPTENPFSNQFEPYINWLEPQLGTDGELSFWAQWKYEYDNTASPVLNGTITDISVWAETIYNAFGALKLAGDTTSVMTVFQQVSSKIDVAAIAGYLMANYNTDLWNFLKNGCRSCFRGMTGPELVTILNHVSGLPTSGKYQGY